MSQQPSGWYEDPNDATLLRYWDGVSWSNRTMPKVKPGLEHVGEARPYTPHQEPPRRDGPPREYPAHWGPEGNGGQSGGYWQGHQHGQNSGYPQQAQWAGTQVGRPGGLWRRLFAALIDRIIVGIVVAICAVPFSGDVGQQMSDWWNDVVNSARAGDNTTPAMPDDVMHYFTIISIASVVVLLAYEIFFTATSGKTPGKRMLGLQVVPCDAAGQAKPNAKVGYGPAGIRSLIKMAGDIIGLIPVVSFFSFIVTLGVLLSGLSNPERRTIGDKTAGTRVVRTK